jgi:hypothetical protein
MQVQSGGRGIACTHWQPRTRRRREASTMLGRIPWERACTHCTGYWVGPRANLNGMQNLSPPRIRWLNCPACSKSPHWVHNPSRLLWNIQCLNFCSNQVCIYIYIYINYIPGLNLWSTRVIQKIRSVCEYCCCSAVFTMVCMWAEFVDSVARHRRNLQTYEQCLRIVLCVYNV